MPIWWHFVSVSAATSSSSRAPGHTKRTTMRIVNKRIGLMSASWWEGERYDTPAARAALALLYADLRLFQNLFQPSMKLVRQERRGSRLLRRYDRPQTPLERVRTSTEADVTKVTALERLFRCTDPFVLAQQIASHLEHVATLRSRVPQTGPRPGVRWRGWTFSPPAPQSRVASAETLTPTIGAGATIGSVGKATVGGNSGPTPRPRPGKNFK